VNHCLYRFFDESGRSLYVGRTIDPAARFRTHRREKSWWDMVSRIELERYPTAEALARAEMDAIAHEEPMFNVVGRFKSKKAFLIQAIESRGWHLAHDLIDGRFRSWGSYWWTHARYYTNDGSPFHPWGHPGKIAAHDTAYLIEFGTLDLCEEAAHAVAACDTERPTDYHQLEAA
jgi:predicted GIY-YIG superfamily endonuclease